jgi:hypothetical protein
MSEKERLLQEVNRLSREHPEAVKKVLESRPHIHGLLALEARKGLLAEKARGHDVESLCAWYELKYGFPPPAHVREEYELAFEGRERGIGTVTFAWRGSWKTVSISVTLVEWFIGNNPTLTNLIVGANDDSAEKVTKAVAGTIKNHPEWKRVFPDVRPDPGSWSTDGFTVKDESMSANDWARATGSRVDPSLVGGGYKSTRLNGKHPTGILLMDDLCDLNNSVSDKERRAVVNALTTIILKTAIRKDDRLTTWVMDVGTPYALDDAHHVMKDSGYLFLRIPAMTKVNEGDEGAVYIDGVNEETGAVYDDIVGWWRLTWPERFGVKSIIAERALGKVQFWQMIMLDLTTANRGGVKHYPFPAGEIDNNWVALGGADPTTFELDSTTKAEEQSHFTLSHVQKMPRGGAVVTGGVVEQCTLLQAEDYIIAAQNLFPNWRGTYVENVGVGKVARQAWARNQVVKVLPSGLKDITDGRVTNKKVRIQGMTRWFEDATILISDADTPFLNALRRLLDSLLDMDSKSHDLAWDVGDAVWHAIRNMPDVLSGKMITDEEVISGERDRSKNKHPLAGIGEYRGYGR